MDTVLENNLKGQLLDRRGRLEEAVGLKSSNDYLLFLLKEVNSALERIDKGIYGICEVCHDPIEEDRLMIDPLVKVCLGDLDHHQQKTLEMDLELASKMQNALLPKKDLNPKFWDIGYTYLPAGPVSGDYCDIISLSNDELLFVLADVTGKGVAASMLMTQIHAIFHSLSVFDMPLEILLEQVNRLICEGAAFSHFATLVCGKIYPNGEVELINAGHCLPIVLKKYDIINIDSSTMPLGLFCNMQYNVRKIKMEKGESIILYTDGLSEAMGKEDEEYGETRIINFAKNNFENLPQEFINLLVNDVNEFAGNSKMNDDLTIMVIKKL
ncbi:MAG: SpoIIE family protein phosphatase [Ignavibacteriaceae bacterium]